MLFFFNYNLISFDLIFLNSRHYFIDKIDDPSQYIWIMINYFYYIQIVAFEGYFLLDFLKLNQYSFFINSKVSNL